MGQKDQKLPSGTEVCDRVLQSFALELGSRCMKGYGISGAMMYTKTTIDISAFGTTLAPKVLVTSIPTESDIRWP